MEYYISVNNDKRGPYSIEELKARGITSETLVMAENSTQWVPAWQVEELRSIIKTPDIPSGQKPIDETLDNDNQKVDDFVEAAPITNGQPTSQAGNFEREARSNHQESNYQQGRPVTPTPPPMEPRQYYAQDHQKKGGCMSKILVTLIILAAIVGLAVATCPDSNAHKAALANVIATAVSEEVNGTDSTDTYDDTVEKMFRQISDTWTQRVIETAVDNLIHVDNHIVFSTGKVRYLGKEHTVSVGVFGHVFTIDKDDLKAAAEQYYSKAEKDTKDDLQKKAEKIINDNVIDPAAQAIKQMINSAMNDIMQDVGITEGAPNNQDEAEPSDSTSR